MQRRWGRYSAVAVAVLTALVTPALVWVGVSAPPAGAEGLRESSTTTYVLDPAAGAVHVTVDLTETNTTPDRNTSNGTEQTYYRGVGLLVLSEAVNVRAVDDAGTALSVKTVPASAPIAKEIDVQFASNLFFNHTTVVHVHFDLPNGAPRSKSLTRVTPAFATFSAWAASSYVNSASVFVLVPRSFTVDLAGDKMTKKVTGNTVTYSATNIVYPSGWYVTVSARDDSKLSKHDITVDNHPIKIRAFPDDPEWGSFVDDRTSKGVPALEQLIGLPWTAGNELLITETVTPYLYGYAGWYSPNHNTIEIGDDLDPQVVLHEISHMWFNNVLFTSRWVDEGLAQEYAARAVVALGGKAATPKAVNEKDPAAVALYVWSDVNVQAQNSREREAFGYSASWYVIHQLTSEVGDAAMRRVFAAASKAEMPYLGTKNPEAGGGAGSWMRFLDYLDELAGSKTADQLFAKFVVAPRDTTLGKRAHARTAYARLVSGSGWKAPLVLRKAMTDWSFASAERIMGTAQSVTKTRDAIEETVRPIGLHSPASLRDAYQDEGSDLDAVLTTANGELDVAKDLVAATNAVNGSHGLLAKIGLIGAKHHSNLANARKQFTAGNAAEAHAAALRAQRTVADAGSAGALRIGVALGFGVLVALIVWILRRRARNRRAAVDAEPGLDGPPGNEPVTSSPVG